MKLGKPGKAVKTYRKADELNQKYNNSIDLTGSIMKAENAAEMYREARLTNAPKKI